MTQLLKSVRVFRVHEAAPGLIVKTQDADGRPVKMVVTHPQPLLADGRWLNGLVNREPAVMWAKR